MDDVILFDSMSFMLIEYFYAGFVEILKVIRIETLSQKSLMVKRKREKKRMQKKKKEM